MMQVFLRVLVIITFFGSSFILFSSETIAQNTAIAPIYIDRAIYKAAQEGLICSKETIEKLDPSEREARKKVCGLELEIDTEELQAPTAGPDIQSSPTEPDSSTVVNSDDEELLLLPDPGVEFVEEYLVQNDGKKSKDTIFYGGVVPFVALPDGELATEDSFFNEESFSVFFYLKRKF